MNGSWAGANQNNTKKQPRLILMTSTFVPITQTSSLCSVYAFWTFPQDCHSGISNLLQSQQKFVFPHVLVFFQTFPPLVNGFIFYLLLKQKPDSLCWPFTFPHSTSIPQWQDLLFLPLKHINNPSPLLTPTWFRLPSFVTIFCLDDYHSLSGCSPSLHAGHTPCIFHAIANVTFTSCGILEILQQLPLSVTTHAVCRHVWSGPCPSSQLGLPSARSLHCPLMATFQFPKAIPLSQSRWLDIAFSLNHWVPILQSGRNLSKPSWSFSGGISLPGSWSCIRSLDWQRPVGPTSSNHKGVHGGILCSPNYRPWKHVSHHWDGFLFILPLHKWSRLSLWLWCLIWEPGLCLAM